MDSTRTFTILSDCSQYGDGITQDEADRMAQAQAHAIECAFPDATVTVQRACGCPPSTNDEEIDGWVDDMIARVMDSFPFNGGDVERTIREWNRIAENEEDTD